MQKDFTSELARLLNFTSQVATAIRMYSSYNQSGAMHEDLLGDLMWLSDCLHGFDQLGRAMLSNNQPQILAACESILSAYQGYQVEDPRFTRQAKAAFERNKKLFSLQEGIDILNAIQAKVMAVSDNSPTPEALKFALPLLRMHGFVMVRYGGDVLHRAVGAPTAGRTWREDLSKAVEALSEGNDEKADLLADAIARSLFDLNLVGAAGTPIAKAISDATCKVY